MKTLRYAGWIATLAGWSATLALSPIIVSAQAYPERPVRIVVPLSPGGGVDTMARILAKHYNAEWNQPVVVDNRTGAGGSIGVELVTKASPDGYTLLMSSSSVITNAATRKPSVSGYDPVRDLQPITQVNASPYLLAVTATLPVANLKQLVELAKTKPGGISFASAGIGSITHMGAELLRSLTGVAMTHVPYRGVADAYPAVASGQVDWILGNPVSVMPLVNAGRLKPIATTGAKRIKSLPDVPTVAESGVPGYEVVGWYGLFAPVGTPAGVVSRLHNEAGRAMQSPDVVRRMEQESSEIIVSSPTEFAKTVRAEFELWRKLARAMHRE